MKTIVAVLLMAFAAEAGGKRVGGYVKKDGAYVEPYARSESNSTRVDNYSAEGNINPYTGKKGSVDPYAPKKAK